MKKFVLLPFDKYQRLMNEDSFSDYNAEHISELGEPVKNFAPVNKVVSEPLIEEPKERLALTETQTISSIIPPPGEPPSVRLETMVIYQLLWN